MKWNVIFTWQGERYQHARQFDSRRAALAVAREMQLDKWTAWIEEVK